MVVSLVVGVAILRLLAGEGALLIEPAVASPRRRRPPGRRGQLALRQGWSRGGAAPFGIGSLRTRTGRRWGSLIGAAAEVTKPSKPWETWVSGVVFLVSPLTSLSLNGSQRAWRSSARTADAAQIRRPTTPRRSWEISDAGRPDLRVFARPGADRRRAPDTASPKELSTTPDAIVPDERPIMKGGGTRRSRGTWPYSLRRPSRSGNCCGRHAARWARRRFRKTSRAGRASPIPTGGSGCPS